jgi:hypothetical protein
VAAASGDGVRDHAIHPGDLTRVTGHWWFDQVSWGRPARECPEKLLFFPIVALPESDARGGPQRIDARTPQPEVVDASQEQP